MGQKSNPVILRETLGNFRGKTEFYGKSSEDFSLFVYKNNELKEYIKRIFALHHLILKNCVIKHLDYNLYLHLSYHTTSNYIKYVVKKKKFQMKIKYKKKDKKKEYTPHKFKKNYNKYNLHNKSKKKPKLRLQLAKSFMHQKKKKNLYIKKKLNVMKIYKKKKKKTLLHSFLKYKKTTTNVLHKNIFVEKLLKSIHIYMKNCLSIKIVFQRIDKGLSLRLKNFQTIAFRNSIMKLKRFHTNSYFDEAINIICISLMKKNSAKLLASFIAFRMSNEKRHNFFLTFLDNAILTFLSNRTLSKVKGIKLVIKGRFNGAPRSKRRIYVFGDIPLQTFSQAVSYNQSTAFTLNGTFGVKVWIC